MSSNEKTTIGEWFSVVKLPLTIEQFHGLPRNAAYKYEYISKCAWLSPRPKYVRARLALEPCPTLKREEPSEVATIQALTMADWQALTPVFSRAFDRVEPFASLSDTRRLEAATVLLERTRHGGDGAVISQASFVAIESTKQRPVGAIIVTVPQQDVPRSLRGKAHLSWVFVTPMWGRGGVATALLHRSIQSLRAQGHTELFSTLLLGNHASMLWHWRSCFELMDSE